MSTDTPDSKVDYVADAVAKELEDLPASSHSEAAEKPPHTPSMNRIFNRQRSLHDLLGGGKAADAFLWKNKLMSAGILGGASVIYFVLEHSGYTLLSILSTLLMITFGTLFLWSNAAALLNRSPPPLPDFHLSEDEARSLALTLREEINKVLAVVHDLALGKDFKLLLKVAAVLWGLSVVGGWFHFLTLVYLAVVVSHTIPALYEKYEDQVDYYAKRAYEEAHNQYRTIDANYLSKLSKGIPKVKKAE
ncbi:hypothetical protein GOP47_0020164 [Adiantum capillus-veneris]|uniref:Reticulon-like protein n=1 Tax=Adiantum capillus-veneris TaxID=13818 RepID=A0A9D4Z8E6_ADICA|nr:hypothetical protein GOP47_0020164 [Adiantum capillus-veneris]